MQTYLADIKSLTTKTFTAWWKDDCLQWGAALAYYAALSLAPLLITLLAVFSLIYQGQGGDSAGGDGALAQQIKRFTGPESFGAVESILKNADTPTASWSAMATGLAMLLIGASGVFAQLQRTLNHVWNVQPSADTTWWYLVRTRLNAMGMVLAIGFVLLLSLSLDTAVTYMVSYADGWLPLGGALTRGLTWLANLLVITFLFGMIFKVLPDVKIAWRDVAAGALCTALLFLLGQFLIGQYLARASVGSAYGAAGSLVVLLVWIYYSSQILFLGAEFTQVWASHRGSQILPDRHAQWTDAKGAAA